MAFRDGPPTKIYGYPKDNGTRLTDGHGKTIAKGRKVNCTKVAGHQPGGWISSERCSYQFKFQGLWYACRGRGDGVSASCTIMQRAPRDQRGRKGLSPYDKLDGWWPFGKKKPKQLPRDPRPMAQTVMYARGKDGSLIPLRGARKRRRRR